MSRHPLPEAADKARTVREMFDRIAPRYDRMNRIISFGMDVGWRRRAVRGLDLAPGSLVLDLACGTGDFCRELERAGYRAAGFDFAREMLRAAKTQVPLVQADVLALPVADRCADGAVSGFALRNVADLTTFFAETARVVRAGGRIALLEVAEPENAVLRAGHRIWFRRAVPFLGSLLSDGDAYRYLPRSVAYLPSKDALIAMAHAGGFGDARSIPLAGGVAQIFTATRS